jgi:hypothetical protein
VLLIRFEKESTWGCVKARTKETIGIVPERMRGRIGNRAPYFVCTAVLDRDELGDLTHPSFFPLGRNTRQGRGQQSKGQDPFFAHRQNKRARTHTHHQRNTLNPSHTDTPGFVRSEEKSRSFIIKAEHVSCVLLETAVPFRTTRASAERGGGNGSIFSTLHVTKSVLAHTTSRPSSLPPNPLFLALPGRAAPLMALGVPQCTYAAIEAAEVRRLGPFRRTISSRHHRVNRAQVWWRRGRSVCS